MRFDHSNRNSNVDMRKHHIHIVVNDQELKLLDQLKKHLGTGYATLLRQLMLEKCRMEKIIA